MFPLRLRISPNEQQLRSKSLYKPLRSRRILFRRDLTIPPGVMNGPESKVAGHPALHGPCEVLDCNDPEVMHHRRSQRCRPAKATVHFTDVSRARIRDVTGETPTVRRHIEPPREERTLVRTLRTLSDTEQDKQCPPCFPWSRPIPSSVRTLRTLCSL